MNLDEIKYSESLVEWSTGKEIFINDKSTPYAFPDCPQCQTVLKKVVGKKLIITKPPYFRFRCSVCDFDNFVQMKFKEIHENYYMK